MANVISWIVAHKETVAVAGVAIIDFLMAVNPNLKSSGILHSIYVFLVGQEAPKA